MLGTHYELIIWSASQKAMMKTLAAQMAGHREEYRLIKGTGHAGKIQGEIGKASGAV